VPTSKLSCPHCGHDGTPETSRPPLGSYGFNYLAEGIVCREVRGFDDTGRLMLSGDFKCEGPQGTGARIECRSCWRTFPVPEGLTWTAVAEEAAQEVRIPAAGAEPPAPGMSATESAAEAISRNLMAILHAMKRQLEGINSGQFARLEATLTVLTGAVDEIPSLKTDLAGLRAEAAEQSRTVAGLGDRIEQLRQEVAGKEAAVVARADSLASALDAARETAGQLAAGVAQIQGVQDVSRHRMDAQAEVIRVLHAAAQEQISRREELKAALQKLEQIAGGLDQVKPLPEGL
jgi:hypothetical protein